MRKVLFSLLLVCGVAAAQTKIDLKTQVKGILAPVNGGTGLDSSAVTGCPSVSAGTWTFSLANCSGTGIDLSSPPPIGDVTPNTGAFTALTAGSYAGNGATQTFLFLTQGTAGAAAPAHTIRFGAPLSVTASYDAILPTLAPTDSAGDVWVVPNGGGTGTWQVYGGGCTNNCTFTGTTTLTGPSVLTGTAPGTLSVGGATASSDAVAVFKTSPGSFGHTAELQSNTSNNRTAFVMYGNFGTPGEMFEFGTDRSSSGAKDFYIFDSSTSQTALYIDTSDNATFFGDISAPSFTINGSQSLTGVQGTTGSVLLACAGGVGSAGVFIEFDANGNCTSSGVSQATFALLTANNSWTGNNGFVGNTQFETVTAATSGANHNSPNTSWDASYWTGSATANDVWSCLNTMGTGTNPTSTFSCTQSGSSGGASFSVPAVKATVYTIGTLPSASSLPAGTMVTVSNGTTTIGTCGTTGTTYQIAITNGTIWTCH